MRPVWLSACQTRSSWARPSASCLRKAAEVQCSASNLRATSALMSCSSEKVKFTVRSRSARQPEHALGDNVALDFVGPRVDRARQRKEVVVQPGADISGIGC